ncbi:hypothetical protein VTO42DRAFT_1238 [Malbranchea cinnamomea]
MSITVAIWPFRRRGKRPRKGAEDSAQLNVTQEPLQAPPRSLPPPTYANSSATLNRRDSKRRKHGSVRSAIDDEAASSGSPRRFLGSVFSSQPRSHSRNPTLCQPPSTNTFPLPHLPTPQFDNNMSQASLNEEPFLVPTLHVKKNTEKGLFRRRSERRKQSDYEREQEIRRLGSMPFTDSSLPREGNNSSSGALARRTSSDTHDSRAFRISPFNALTPRPTLRYAHSLQYTPAASRSVSRSSTTKGKRPVMSETPLVGSEKINDLADDMDAGDLRALLERDQRRNMKSRGAPEFLNRKLQAQADGERGRQPGQPLPGSHNSGSWLDDPSRENLAQEEPSTTDTQTVASALHEQAAVPTKKAVPSVSHLPPTPAMSTSDISHSFKNEKPNSGAQFGRSLAGIFRRASSRMKRREAVSKPPSFSIPSRESFTRSHQIEIAQAQDARYVPSKPPLRHAGFSNRIGSRFTEHLSDSPDAPETTVQFEPPNAADDMYAASRRISTIDRYSVSFVSTVDVREERVTRANSPDTRPDSLLLAHSLASIDSEGSWLSGKPSRRLSQAHHNSLRKSASSTKERLDGSAEPGEYDDSAEDNNVFGKFSVLEEESGKENGPKLTDLSRRITHPDAIGQTADNEQRTFHASVGKRPVLVSPPSRAKSTEGLFTIYRESAPEEAPGTPGEEENYSEIQRATSIDLGRGHARHISAGSAKLLDLSAPRMSDSKKSNSETVEAPNTNSKADE